MAKKQSSRDSDQIEEADTIAVEPAAASSGSDPDLTIVQDPVDANLHALKEAIGHDDEQHDTHRSIKARLVSALVIFLIGGIAALWVGPKIAPGLPAGLAPVSRWLTPGQDAALKAVLDAKTELNARIDAIEPGIGQPQAEDLIAGALTPVEQDLGSRLTKLEGAAPRIDSELGAKLSGLEIQVSGLAAELDSLVAQPVTGTDAGPTAVEISRLTARLDGLQARIGQLSTQHAALKQQVAAVAADARAGIAVAQTEIIAAETEAEKIRQSAETQALLTAITAAVASGARFDGALDQLYARNGTEAPMALRVNSASGLATILQLREEFPQAAHEAIRADIMEVAGSGITARLGGFLKAQVASRSLTPQDGTGADAVLSRVDAALRDDDLGRAVDEAKALSPAAGKALQAWLARAEARLAAEVALAAITPTAN